MDNFYNTPENYYFLNQVDTFYEIYNIIITLIVRVRLEPENSGS